MLGAAECQATCELAVPACITAAATSNSADLSRVLHGRRTKPRKQLKRMVNSEDPAAGKDEDDDEDDDLVEPPIHTRGRPAVDIGRLSGLGASLQGEVPSLKHCKCRSPGCDMPASMLAMSEILILNAGNMLDNSHGWDRQGTSCLLSVKRSDYKGVRSICLLLLWNPLLHGQISGSFMRKIEALMLQTMMRRKMKKKRRRK